MEDSEEKFCLCVDYSMPLYNRVAAGGYNYVTDYLKHFPISGEGIVCYEARLKQWEKPRWMRKQKKSHAELSSYDMPIAPRGWVLGSLEHLLDFGAKYPDIQKEFIVQAIGSRYDLDIGRSYKTISPDLWHSYAGRPTRTLNCFDWSDTWSTNDMRYLIVRPIFMDTYRKADK